MKNIIKNIPRSSIIIAGAFGLGALVSVFNATSFAYANVQECEVSHPYCIGAPSLSYGADVKETSVGRTLNKVPAGDGDDTDFKLRFVADTHKCVGEADTTNSVVVKSCSGNNIIWGEYFTGTGLNHRWQNQAESNRQGSPQCMTGFGTGSTYWVQDCFTVVQVFQTQ